MKELGRALIFILSTLLRTVPFFIFILTHLAWGVFSYSIDPMQLLAPAQIPGIIGEFNWLYLALGVIILVFLTLEFKLLAYFTFFGAWAGQNLHFFRQWDNLIYDRDLPSLQPTWYALLFFGLLIGFLLQVLFTGGPKYWKVRQYNRMRQQRQKARVA